MIYEIGEAAGRVWQFLHENGAVSLKSLKEGTELKQQELNRAIGWLAREEKLLIEGSGSQEIISLAE